MAEDKPSSERKSLRQLEKANSERAGQRAAEHLRGVLSVLDEPIRLGPEPETNLGKILDQIPGVPVRKDNPAYHERGVFISWLPEQLKELEVIEPFFIFNNGTWEVNKTVAPFVWDPNINQSQRFIEAEKYTKGDSGLFAVCAVSAPTPDKQASLYKGIASDIIEVHKNNPELLIDWLTKQLDPQARSQASSFDVFHSFDHVIENGKINLRPQEEVLVAFEPEEFEKIWQNRIDELKEEIAHDNLQLHHFRWIEFLSHSVNTAELLQRHARQY